MRRRDVSPEELARIIRLRESNTSWLQIQRDTLVPRRIAQRAYEEYLRNQAREELRAARKDVAAEEFRKHMHSLIKLAQSLVNHLRIPATTNQNESAKEILLNLWQSDIVEEYGAYGLPQLNRNRETYRPETCLRQNQILFKSLQTHTHKKVDWQALSEWENAWDTCRTACAKLREEAHKILLNILNQRAELTDRIVKGSQKKDAVERMVDGVLHIVWESILVGKVDQDFPLVRAMSRGEGITEVLFGEGGLTLGLIFTEANLAKEVVDTSKWLTKNLWFGENGKTVQQLVNDVHGMRKAIEELKKRLNPLMLGPLILHTQCDLCPA